MILSLWLKQYEKQTDELQKCTYVVHSKGSASAFSRVGIKEQAAGTVELTLIQLEIWNFPSCIFCFTILDPIFYFIYSRYSLYAENPGVIITDAVLYCWVFQLNESKSLLNPNTLYILC